MRTRLVMKCAKCGVELSSHGKSTSVCRACYRVPAKFCKTCRGPLDPHTRAIQCRACWKARGAQPLRFCASCSKPLTRYTSPEIDKCRTCRIAPPRACVDCGKPLSMRNVKSPRCWECHTERRQGSAAQKSCTIERCTNKHVAKGLCAIHYERMRLTKSRKGKHIDTRSRVWVAQQPCQICGYARLRSHVHRPIAQGDYVVGNMVALCSRCHNEVHFGLIPCPAPLIPTLIAGSGP